MEWKLWYTDRSTYSSEDGPWVEATARGVAGLLYPSPKAGVYVDTDDFYLWPDWSDHPYAADAWGLVDHLLHWGVLDPDQPLSDVPFSVLREAGVKLGRTLSAEDWEPLYLEMANDPDFPDKSAHHRDERVP